MLLDHCTVTETIAECCTVVLPATAVAAIVTLVVPVGVPGSDGVVGALFVLPPHPDSPTKVANARAPMIDSIHTLRFRGQSRKQNPAMAIPPKVVILLWISAFSRTSEEAALAAMVTVAVPELPAVAFRLAGANVQVDSSGRPAH
jgi:hypothetical protein